MKPGVSKVMLAAGEINECYYWQVIGKYAAASTAINHRDNGLMASNPIKLVHTERNPFILIYKPLQVVTGRLNKQFCKFRER